MNPLWIGQSIIHDGQACFNTKLITLYTDSTPLVHLAEWPYDDVLKIPKTSSARAQIFTYGENHFTVSPQIFLRPLHACERRLIITFIVLVLPCDLFGARQHASTLATLS